MKKQQRTRRAEIEAKIEYEEVIGDAKPGDYQSIRFSRVKYKASPETHIDIRKFQRAYDDDGDEVYYPTRSGFRFLEREFRRVVKSYTLMPETFVHPRIVAGCFDLLNSGQYESAVLQAFKATETMIRDKVGASADEVGVRLIRRALNPEDGPLTDETLPKAEREALCNYVAGAFGYYKNPVSHREVQMDYAAAFDRILVARDLLKIVESTTVTMTES